MCSLPFRLPWYVLSVCDDDDRWGTTRELHQNNKCSLRLGPEPPLPGLPYCSLAHKRCCIYVNYGMPWPVFKYQQTYIKHCSHHERQQWQTGGCLICRREQLELFNHQYIWCGYIYTCWRIRDNEVYGCMLSYAYLLFKNGDNKHDDKSRQNPSVDTDKHYHRILGVPEHSHNLRYLEKRMKKI